MKRKDLILKAARKIKHFVSFVFTCYIGSMILIEIAARLLILLGKTVAKVVMETIKIIITTKSYLTAIWIVTTFLCNLTWIVRSKSRSNIIIPMLTLLVVNIVFTLTCMQELFLLAVKIPYPVADVMCKFVKWIETTCVLMASIFIVYILNIFRHPQTLEKQIKKNVLLVLVIVPVITVTQVSFK